MAWIGSVLLDVPLEPHSYAATDNLHNCVGLGCLVALAALLAVAWPLVTYTREPSSRVLDRSRAYAALYLGAQLLVYGWKGPAQVDGERVRAPLLRSAVDLLRWRSMSLVRRIALAALAMGLHLIAVESAQACTCTNMRLGPGRLYLGTGGTLPAGAVGIPWSGTPDTSREQVRVTREAGGRHGVVKHDLVRVGELVLIVPRTGLKPGDVYTVRVREEHFYKRKKLRARLEREFGGVIPPAEITATVTVTATSLELTGATLRVTDHAERFVPSVMAGSGTCGGGDIKADTVAISVELPPAAEPYRDYLLYRTLVDDGEWRHLEWLCDVIEPGRTWTRDPGTDLIFSDCDHRLGFWPGRHRVMVEVSSPDGKYAATAVGEVELAFCRTSEPPTEPAPPPAPVPEAAPATSHSPEPPPLRRSGCVVADAHDGSASIVFGPLAALLLRRRRRRSRDETPGASP